MKTKQIQDRFVPSVAGIDLEHALNYVSADGLPLEWFYSSFTYPRTFYQAGSRPELERFLSEGEEISRGSSEGLFALVQRVYENIRHYSLLGFSGPVNRNFSEEELLRSGEGWCNEQARVLCVLAQICGWPARLVFAGMRSGRGHVLVEVFHEGQWVLIDQTATYVFQTKDDSFANVLTAKTASSDVAGISERYLAALQAEKEKTKSLKDWERIVPYGMVDDPLELFYSVGYSHYFVH